MRLLLDTHVLLWWLGEPERLADDVLTAIADGSNEVFISSASIWEMTIKVSIGKLLLQRPLSDLLAQLQQDALLQELPVRHLHAARVLDLPHHHRDPFDRIMIAQAAVEGLRFISADSAVFSYDGDFWDARR